MAVLAAASLLIGCGFPEYRATSSVGAAGAAGAGEGGASGQVGGGGTTAGGGVAGCDPCALPTPVAKDMYVDDGMEGTSLDDVEPRLGVAAPMEPTPPGIGGVGGGAVAGSAGASVDAAGVAGQSTSLAGAARQ